MSYEEVDSENTDIPESVRRERRIRKANEENPIRIDEVIEAYKPKEFNKLADRYDELGYDGLAKHYRRKDKEEKKRKPNGCFAVITCVFLILYVLSNFVSIEFDDTYNSSNSTVETTDIESKTEPETETEPSIWVTTTRVKVRTEPNTNCDVLGVLDAGVQIDYTGDANEEWVTIDYNGQEAYVYKKYIQELINNEVYNSEEIPETSVVETLQETEESLEIADNKENSVTSIETQSYGTNILESLQYASDDVSSALNVDYDLRSVPDMIELIKYPDKYIGKLCYVYGFAAGLQDLGNVSEQYGNNLTGGNEIHVVRIILDIVNMKKHYLAFDTLMRAADIREFNMRINNPDGGRLIYGCLGRVYTTDQDNCFFINGASDIYKRKPEQYDSYTYLKNSGWIDEDHNIYE